MIAEDGGVVDMVALGKKVVLPVLLPAGWVRQLQENKDCRLGSDVQPIAASDATQDQPSTTNVTLWIISLRFY